MRYTVTFLCLLLFLVFAPHASSGGSIPGAGSWEGKTSEATKAYMIQGHMDFAIKRRKIVYVQIFSRCETFVEGPVKIPIRAGRFSYRAAGFFWRGNISKNRARGTLRITKPGCSSRLHRWQAVRTGRG